MKLFWRCPCGEVIYLEDAFVDNEAVDEITGQLEGLNHDKGFLLTNVRCEKCNRVLIINFDVTRESETIKTFDGKDLELPKREEEENE